MRIRSILFMSIGVLLVSTAGLAHAAKSQDAGQAVHAYQEEAMSLSEQPADPKHPAEVKALRQLADALEALPQQPATVQAAVSKIRENADRIEKSKPTAIHSDWAKDALQSASEAIDSMRSTTPRGGDLDQRLTTAKEAIDKIDAKQPFLAQRETIDNAFVRVGDALAAAAQGAGAVSQAEQQPVGGQEETPPPETPPPPPPVEETPPPPVTVTHYTPMPRFNISAGGGVADFADDASRHLTTIGGMWDVRLLIGENTAFAGEVAYVGTANGVNNVMAQFAPNGTILGSSVEGDFRLQLPRHMFPVRPFGFYGIGWNHFDLVEENFRNPIAINSSDDAFVMPFGGGLQFDLGEHIGLDTRFTYRAMFDEDLLHTNNNGVPGVSSQGMSQWALSTRLGYTF